LRQAVVEAVELAVRAVVNSRSNEEILRDGVISAHKRSGKMGAALLDSRAARCSRQAATMPAARSANDWPS